MKQKKETLLTVFLPPQINTETFSKSSYKTNLTNFTLYFFAPFTDKAMYFYNYYSEIDNLAQVLQGKTNSNGQESAFGYHLFETIFHKLFTL